MSVHVRQSPLELLATTAKNLVAVKQTEGVEEVVAWQDERGELFYKAERADHPSEFVVGPFGLDDHAANEKDRVWRLTTAMTLFLWDTMDAKSWGIVDLFVQFGARPMQRRELQDDDDLFIDFDTFVNFFETSKFQMKQFAPSQQELFAVFRSIQCLSLEGGDIDRISFDAFRTWLIDPFHTMFWKYYVRRIVSCGESFDELSDKLHREFDISAKRPNNKSLLWNEFLVTLDRFHAAIGIDFSPAEDKCRLLYRFDSYGVGKVSASAFVDHVIDTLRHLQDARNDFRARLQFDKAKPRRTAVLNSRLRPNVETFTSADAVRSLFAARALAANRESKHTISSERLSSTTADRQAPSPQQSRYQQQLELMAEGNARLASMRSLPVTRLVREGTFFRGPAR